MCNVQYHLSLCSNPCVSSAWGKSLHASPSTSNFPFVHLSHHIRLSIATAHHYFLLFFHVITLMSLHPASLCTPSLTTVGDSFSKSGLCFCRLVSHSSSTEWLTVHMATDVFQSSHLMALITPERAKCGFFPGSLVSLRQGLWMV